jgi:hypothetical protein
MKWALYIGIIVLGLTLLYILTMPQKSCYAPPRDKDTVMPFVENVNDQQDNQTEVFKDAAGWLNMREHPLTGFFQEDAFANVAVYGDFVSLESSAGDVTMTVIPKDEQYEYNGSTETQPEYLPSITSRNIAFIGEAPQASSTSPEATQ